MRNPREVEQEWEEIYTDFVHECIFAGDLDPEFRFGVSQVNSSILDDLTWAFGDNIEEALYNGAILYLFFQKKMEAGQFLYVARKGEDLVVAIKRGPIDALSESSFDVTQRGGLMEDVEIVRTRALHAKLYRCRSSDNNSTTESIRNICRVLHYLWDERERHDSSFFMGPQKANPQDLVQFDPFE